MDREQRIELYNKIVDAVPEIERKGKTMPYTSHNGHMYSFVAKEDYVAIRLGKEDYNKFHEEVNPEPAISYGATMREYVVIPDDMLKETLTVANYLQLSLNYIKTLKPKATKKKS